MNLPTPAVMPSELLPNAGGVLGGLYTADQMKSCRESALEEAAIDAERYGHVWSGEPAHAFFELAEDIRSLK